MARGIPALWSALVGSPILGAGLFAYYAKVNVSSDVGIPFILFGGFVLILGLYIQIVAAPDQPTMRENEEIVDTRNPAQRAAIARTLVGFGGLVIAVYLLFFTFEPYVYPTVALLVGLYLFSTGLHAYWTNTLTTYYVTTRRIVKEYRFISLARQEIPFEKVRGVGERRTIWESLVGLGNVRVASGGGGGTLEVVVRNIYSPTAFADKIRQLM